MPAKLQLTILGRIAHFINGLKSVNRCFIPEPTARSAVRGYQFRTAIYTREKESIAKSEVHQISRGRGSRVVVSGWSSLVSKIWRTILHYNISYFCKRIWQLSQLTKGGHFRSQEYGGLSGVAST